MPLKERVDKKQLKWMLDASSHSEDESKAPAHHAQAAVETQAPEAQSER